MNNTKMKPIINNLINSDKGRWVEYKSKGGDKTEKGKIKSWNDNWIFVVYNCANNWDRYEDYTANATKPDDLTFINEK
jgi:hypothetical protein